MDLGWDRSKRTASARVRVHRRGRERERDGGCRELGVRVRWRRVWLTREILPRRVVTSRGCAREHRRCHFKAGIPRNQDPLHPACHRACSRSLARRVHSTPLRSWKTARVEKSRRVARAKDRPTTTTTTTYTYGRGERSSPYAFISYSQPYSCLIFNLHFMIG